jgi:predicted GIY-YIG superfamily endonuclease
MISASEQRTALYRFYDASENLLYVGITNDPWRRWRQHVQEKSWYPQVKHQAVTWYDSRIRAEVAEQVAIRCEHPRFNIAGALRPVPDEASAEPAPDPSPVDEAEAAHPEPGPAETPTPDRRRRTFIVLLVCGAWAFLPQDPGMPSWHTPWMKALIISTVIPVLIYMLVAAAPSIQRFGRWLSRTLPTVAPVDPEDSP